jgi:LPXTG-motif cell wall-anchored protein
VDRSFEAVSKDCSGIRWSQKALAAYPTIAAACEGVQQRDGKTYVKFTGTVKRNVNRGERLVVDFNEGGEITLTPPRETKLYVNNKPATVAELRPGDELNFYIAEDRLAAQFPQTEAMEIQTARLVIVPIMIGEPAQSERMAERMAATLPSTASSLPLLAVGGVALIGVGVLLTLYRRRR